MKKISLLVAAILMITVIGCKKSENNKNSENTVIEKETTMPKEAKEKETSLRHSLEFTAFKTPKKVGVKGTFKDITLTNTSSGNITEMLTNANFEIVTASIDTKDPTRDIKLKEFFFDNLANPKITGTFKSFEGNKAVISIQMNDVTKDIPFEYTATEKEILLSGSIDMIEDFSANKAFNAIHEACKILHEDKTWTDVELNLTIGK
ncbi:hypothetical protein JoomaDRAFT_3894 [Galbibacter orientalis DSM 19592]|uniref:Lipid/polyisoprenoid-binding YceI-like domain-containing protein n=1 Tax=Galbibacter orientalis DSM 19592 TaxID=926559 RepID=I3CB29_9FLAO|nr:YceI family protein [Galbibacter orientalis]EIJ40822.1 hypothetical protein JoomaDRAFT_3894 [Galbibacter orientalis DSM 19592]